MGFLFLFVVDSRSSSSVLPLTLYFLCALPRILHSQQPLSLHLRSALLYSKPFGKYFTIQLCPPCWGTLRSVTLQPHLLFWCWNSNGRGCSSGWFLASGSTPSSILLSGPHLVAQLQLHPLSQLAPYCPVCWHPTASFLPWLARCCCPSTCSLPSVAIQKYALVMPILLATANAILAHPLGTPH